MIPISDASFNLLIWELDQFFKLNKAQKELLRSMLFEADFRKGDNILNPGALQVNAWFVIEGILREISIQGETLNRKTVWFWTACNFVYTTPGFFDQEPSDSYIKVVKDCKVVFISYKNWKIIKETYTEIDNITEKIRGAYEKMRHTHASDLKSLTTKDRYLKYKKAVSKILPYTQLQYVAEYLGMSPDTLGRHRRDY